MCERILAQNCQKFDNFNLEFSMSHHNARYQSYKNAPACKISCQQGLAKWPLPCWNHASVSLNCTRRFKNHGNYRILKPFQQLKHFIKDLEKPDQIWVRSFKRLVLISPASATAAARQQLLKPVGHGCTVFTSLLATTSP